MSEVYYIGQPGEFDDADAGPRGKVKQDDMRDPTKPRKKPNTFEDDDKNNWAEYTSMCSSNAIPPSLPLRSISY